MKYDKNKIGKQIKDCRKKILVPKYGERNLGKKLPMSMDDLGAALGIERRTIASYEKGKTMPPLDVMLRMCEIFGCELGHLLDEPGYELGTRLKTEIRNTTGLDKSAIDILTDKKAMVDRMLADNGETTDFNPYAGYLEAVNLIITEGGDFVDSFRIALLHSARLQNSKREHIESLGISDAAVAVAVDVFGNDVSAFSYEDEAGGHFSLTDTLPLDQFKLMMKSYKFSIKGSKKRILTDEELIHLYKYCQDNMLFKPELAKWNCEKQLYKIFTALEEKDAE